MSSDDGPVRGTRRGARGAPFPSHFASGRPYSGKGNADVCAEIGADRVDYLVALDELEGT